jgi:hypothetical protein
MEKKLLKRIMELHHLSNDSSQWSIVKFDKNPPALYRLKMINSMFEVLEIKVTYEQFIKGEFLNKLNMPEVDKIVALLSNYGKFKLPINPEDKWGVDQAQHTFLYLMKYRLYLNQLENIGSEVYAASGYYRLPFVIFAKLHPPVKRESKVIDALLRLFINPTKLKLSKEELIAIFNYPTVKLSDLDLEWM